MTLRLGTVIVFVKKGGFYKSGTCCDRGRSRKVAKSERVVSLMQEGRLILRGSH